MKRIIIPISALFVVGISHGQTLNLSSTENYIYSKTYLHYPNPTDADQTIKSSETVQYFDGLGRAKQVVNIKASPLGRDVVTPIEYDAFGRQVKDYLPIPQSQTLNGSIISNPSGNISSVYGTEKIFAEKIIENSPLDRIRQQIQVGNDWSNKPVTFDYGANVSGEVVKYTTTTIWENGATKSTPFISGSYGSSQLYKKTITDEDGNKTIEFTNGQGQTLLVRKVVSVTDNADTYYVYNEYNQLAFVIPPLAVSANAVDDTTLKNLCYQYKYDGRNRLVEKKLPGKDWEYMVYDKADRLIATQDANLRPDSRWLVTKYDTFGRVIYTGIMPLPNQTREGLQVITNNFVITESKSAQGFTMSGMQIYYTNDLYNQIDTILSVNYYDTYPLGTPTFTPTLPNDGLLTDSQSSSLSTKSLPLASYVKNIEDDNWTKNYTWYDQKGRPIGTHSINHLGGYTKTESEINFAGLAQKTTTSHLRKQGESGIIVRERFTYDNQNRPKQHFHQVDGNLEELLTENTYNELSQIANKKVGNNLQSIDYAYNIRGWMTDINKDQMSLSDLGGKLFSYKIKYNQKDGITNPDTSQFSGKDVIAKYNGNIAEVDWRAVENIGNYPSLTPKRYGYAYDRLNRLSAGYYQNPMNPNSKENTESLTYDLNGNITNLYRTSVIEGGTNTATVIDNIAYTYTGNQAIKIKDHSGNKTGYEGTAGYPVEYDVNGNMTSMIDKKISAIGYNYLNLPNLVTLGFSQVTTDIATTYSANGTKNRKSNTKTTVQVAGITWEKEITDYLDGFQYLNKTNSGGGGGGMESRFSAAEAPTILALEEQAFTEIGERKVLNTKTPELQFFPTGEGFYDYIKDQYIYQYNDHLGNVRVSFGRSNAGALEIVDANDYYPFGMNHLKTGGAYFGAGAYQNYKYQGQELQEIGFYSFKWRNYMPDVGRFFNVDPLAEKFPYNSTYAFSENRVIDAVELEGLEAWLIHGTWSDNSSFSKPVNDLAKKIGGGTVYSNNWSGENNRSARTQAATDLYNNIISTRNNIFGTNTTNKPIVLLGHSHGGNVAIETFNMLTERFKTDMKNGVLSEMPEMTLVTVNTPVRSDYQLSDDASGVVDHVNVYADRDSVQKNGGNVINLGEANQIYRNAININYQDQISRTDSSGCGVTNHCGTASENAKVWAPQVQSQVSTGRALNKTLKPQ